MKFSFDDRFVGLSPSLLEKQIKQKEITFNSIYLKAREYL